MGRLGRTWNSKMNREVTSCTPDIIIAIISVVLLWLIVEVHRQKVANAVNMGWKILKCSHGIENTTDKENAKERVSPCLKCNLPLALQQPWPMGNSSCSDNDNQEGRAHSELKVYTKQPNPMKSRSSVVLQELSNTSTIRSRQSSNEKHEKHSRSRELTNSLTLPLVSKTSESSYARRKSVRFVDPYRLHRCDSMASLCYSEH